METQTPPPDLEGRTLYWPVLAPESRLIFTTGRLLSLYSAEPLRYWRAMKLPERTRAEAMRMVGRRELRRSDRFCCFEEREICVYE